MIVKQYSIHRSRANYIWEKKTSKLQVHPYKPVSWLPTHHFVVAHSSPDEWATTKQACRDELVVYLFFSPIYIYIYIYIYISDWIYKKIPPNAGTKIIIT